MLKYLVICNLFLLSDTSPVIIINESFLQLCTCVWEGIEISVCYINDMWFSYTNSRD